MASAFGSTALQKGKETVVQDSPNTALVSWSSILRALQHPQYVSPTLKPCLLSRIKKLQECADVYFFTREKCLSLTDSIMIDGVKFDVSQQQKELTEKLSKEVMLEPSEAYRIVVQQLRIGIVDLDGLVKAYLDERLALLRIVKCLVNSDLEQGNTNRASVPLATEIVAKIKEKKDFILKIVEAVKQRVEQQLPGLLMLDQASAMRWSRQYLLEEHDLGEILFLITEKENPSSEVVKAWFSLMQDSLLYSNQRNVHLDSEPLNEIMQALQAISIAISVKFTTLPDVSLDTLSKDRSHFFSSPDSIVHIQNAMKSLVPEVPVLAPVALNWALTMHRLFSSLTGGDEELPNSHIQAIAQVFETDDDFIEWHRYFAQIAFEQHAFSILITILDTLSGADLLPFVQRLFQVLFFSTFHMVPFDDSIVAAFAAIHSQSSALSGEFWHAVQEETSSPASDLLFAVRSRFPLSFLPQLTLLSSSLHNSTKETVFNYFQTLPTYTQTLQRGFTGYDVMEEEPDSTLITLKTDLRVFAERDDGEGGVIVQNGTIGRLLSRGESVPTVMWEWPFNGWALIGRVLETALMKGVANVVLDASFVPVILEIFRLLEGTIAGSKTEFVENVVAATSEEMAQEWDLVSVTYEIVSQALEVLDVGLAGFGEVESLLEIASLGIKVLANAVLGQEASIWSLIVKGGSKWWGRISRIALTFEMSAQTQCMPVTLAAVGLADALFSGAIANSILSDGFSSHLRREVLWTVGGYILDLWITFNELKYLIPDKRFEIGEKLCSLFNRVISQVYTVDGLHTPENRISGILAPTADRILEMFLLDDLGRPFEALFYACYVTKEVLQSYDNGLERPPVRKVKEWCISALSLAERIIRMRVILSPDSLAFELHIYRQLKLLNSLLFFSPFLQAPVFKLLKTLVTAAQPENREQPSILAHLGGDDKKHIPLMMELVSDPFADPETRTSLWRYASGVMSSQQQGLAILLLFGADTGRKTANKPAIVEDKEEKETLLRKAVTMIVDNDLKFTHLVEREVFHSITEFLCKAHNSWAPILITLRQDKALWAKLLILLAWSGAIIHSSDSPERTKENCWRLHTAAAAIDTIAVEIFHAGNMPQAASIEVLRDHLVTKKDVNLQDIAPEAFRIRGYRDSLFFHLRRNLQTTFPNADILRFQRIPPHGYNFGEDYFFDIEVGRAVLGKAQKWQGFEKEIRLANLNMSIVDAQLELLTSWQHLALAWDENAQKTLPLEGRSVILAKACLEANIAEAKMHALLRTTMVERATLAFSVVNNPSAILKTEEIKTVLRLAFNALVAPELMFFDCLAEGKFDISQPLMRTLITCLKRLDKSKDRSPALLLDIFEAIVAKGASNLFTRARAHPDEDECEMITLVIAIAQEILDLSQKDSIISEFSNKLMDHNSMESAVKLFSISHEALVSEQPVLSELSLQYMVTLCAAPRVPEQLAVAGIIAVIMESPISSVLQSADIRAPQNHMLHRIWTRGVLPVISNLLQTLGSRILRDVVAFLRLYEQQIQAAFTEWSRPKIVTTALIDETLLLLVLFEDVDKHMQMEHDRFMFTGKEDLLENVNNLLAHPRFLARLVHPTNVDEERLMEEKKEGEFKNGLVAKVAGDLAEMRGLLGVAEQ